MTAINLFDRVPLAGVRKDSAGNLVAVCRAARTGVQEYRGFEVGRPDLTSVRVYRPEEEVFNRDSMASFAGVPVTIDHPPELVTTDNWSKYATGETSSDEIVRDGETVKVPFLLRDAAAIAAVEDGKHEISMGYTAEIEFRAGQTTSGEQYDAIQRRLRMNHLAIVDAARAGPVCRIGDQRKDDEMTTKPYVFDGITIQVTDAAEQALAKQAAQIKTLSDAAAEKQTALDAAIKDRDEAKGKVTALEQQLKDATNPAALAAAAAARADLLGKCKALVPSIVTDGKDDATLRKEVVTAKLGDAAKELSDDAINGAFVTLAAGVKVGQTDQLAQSVIGDASAGAADMTKLVEQRDAALANRNAALANGGKVPEQK